MKNVILAGFEGCNNSASALVEKADLSCTKLILPNDYDKSVKLLNDKIKEVSAVCVVILGQKPCISDKIAVEPSAKCNGESLHTKMDCTASVKLIKNNGYNAYISQGCGNSYCNNIYFECLKAGVNCIFLHVPYLKNISDFTALKAAIDGYINGIGGIPAYL